MRFQFWQIGRELAAVLLLLLARPCLATLTVNPAQEITKQVTVQLIRTALDNGSSPATVFGNATQRATIEAGLDTIWAQAGIDINVLPTVKSYNNTFAYQGNAGSGTRPTGDLNTIFTNAASAGILSSDPLTLNLIMVNVVPGFAPLSEDTSAGYARVGGNGINGYVGDSLLTFANGLDVISSVMAHEIGHNLGLNHTTSGMANLMSPNGSSQQLTDSQITTSRSSNFARLFTPPTLDGDYNNNGAVDAADYVVWRKSIGGPMNYTNWRSHFGQSAGVGAGLGTSAVPEPGSVVSLLALVLLCLWSRRRGRPYDGAGAWTHADCFSQLGAR